MADYAELLRRAMAVGRPNAATRREIYTQARAALLRSLRNKQGISPHEITSQRLLLEEAIREVEHDASMAHVSAAANSDLHPE